MEKKQGWGWGGGDALQAAVKRDRDNLIRLLSFFFLNGLSLSQTLLLFAQ